jgi:hypothetical protein
MPASRFFNSASQIDSAIMTFSRGAEIGVRAYARP